MSRTRFGALVATTEMDPEPSSLVPWHWGAALAHLAQGVAALVLGLTPSDTRFARFKVPQLRGRVDWDTMAWTVDHLYDFPFVAVLSACAFVSVAGHVAHALRPRALEEAGHGRFAQQWVEYAVSSSLMMAAILMLCGVWDVTTLCVASWCNAMMCLMGIVTERAWTTDRRPRDGTSFWIGAALGVAPWGVVMGNLFSSNDLARIPPFVFVVIFGYLALFCLFPAVMWWQFSAHPGRSQTWANLRAAKAYVLLSLTAKALLLWTIIGGVSQPNALADA